MATFALTRLDDIGEIDDGRCPFRLVRHHSGITTFGVNAMTAHFDGDRLINEHDEAEPDSSEELYVVVSGHATACFESRARRHDAAIAHLQRAIELSPSLADVARDDEDLAALPERSEFAKILEP